MGTAPQGTAPQGTAVPEVAVVVPTFERPDRLVRLVRALEAQTLPSEQWELIVVDNGSGDETPAALDKLANSTSLRLRCVRLDHNRGPASARNVGWRSSSAPYLAFTDDDCVPRPGWLEAGITALARSRNVGIVQGQTVRPLTSNPDDYTDRTVIREVLEPSPWFEGCNLFFRRAAIEDGGGFDEAIGWFGEETALAWTVLDRGWDRGWAPGAVVEHDVDDRPVRWHLRNHWLEGNLVHIAAQHPSIRAWFWRPWAIKRENALFALAVVGLAGGLVRRPALVLTLPYLHWLPRPWASRDHFVAAVRQATYHGASLAGKLAAGVRYRALVL